MKILKNTKRYIGAPEDDYHINLNLESSRNIYTNNIQEFNVNQNDVFNRERNSSQKYLFHGKLEILSNSTVPPYVELGYISGYKIDYGIKVVEVRDGGIVMNKITDFNIGDKIIYYGTKTKKHEITKVSHYEQNDNRYILFLDKLNISIGDVITLPIFKMDRFYTPINTVFKVFKSAFSVNIFGDPIYQFLNEKDIILNQEGFLGTPLTEVYYRTVDEVGDTFEGIVFNELVDSDNMDFLDIEVIGLTGNPFLIDRVEFNMNDFELTKLIDYTYVKDNLESTVFHEMRIRESGEVVEESFSNVINPPAHTTYFLDGDVFYKYIKDKSDVNIDSIYDFPFMNGMHYVFSDLKYIINDKSDLVDETDFIGKELVDDYEYTKMVNANKERLC